MEMEKTDGDTHERKEEIPGFFEPGYVERVVDALPYYFPNYLKERLKREHPDIPVTTIEGRYNHEREEEKGTIPEEEREALRILTLGSKFCDELVAESLSLTILKDQYPYLYKDSHYWEYKIQPFLEGYGEKYGYNTAIELLEKLQVSSLSGDFRDINAFLREKFDIKSMFDLLLSISIAFDKKQKNIKGRKKTLATLMKPLYVAGSMHYDNLYIYLNTKEKDIFKLFNKTSACSAAISGSLLLTNPKDYPVLAPLVALSSISFLINQHYSKKADMKIKNTSIHEVLHYLSYDSKTKRNGFVFPNYYDYEKMTETY